MWKRHFMDGKVLVLILSVVVQSNESHTAPCSSGVRPSHSLSSFPTGRGLKSHAYIHSVQFSHHVFLNLHTLKFYCLPDNYEIIDSSLEDITVCVQEGWFGSSSPGSHPRDPGNLPHLKSGKSQSFGL